MTSGSSPVSTKPHVVIVGAGFAGLECARRLARSKQFDITLIDRHNFHVFQPLLYQVSTGMLSPSNAAFNLRALLRKATNVEIKMSDVCRVDLATRTVYGQSGDRYTGDYLVLAVGSQPNFFDTPGASTNAFPLYSLQDAERLRTRLLSLCEAAETAQDGLSGGLEIVVVGGGATGVEVAGAIADLTKGTPKHLYRKVKLAASTVTLVDGGKSVLSPFRDKSQEYAARMLRKRGIHLRLGVHVKEVKTDSVLLSDGASLPSQVTIWAGGLKAAELSTNVGVACGKGGRLDVDGEFRIPGYLNVFALGDFANFKGPDGSLLPQLASVAKQAGRQCAENIMAARKTSVMKPFRYKDKGIMAMIGRSAAVAEVGRSRFIVLGKLAFLAWIGVHVLLLDSLWIMLTTLIEWISDYLGKVNVAAILDHESQADSDQMRATNDKRSHRLS